MTKGQGQGGHLFLDTAEYKSFPQLPLTVSFAPTREYFSFVILSWLSFCWLGAEVEGLSQLFI